MAMVRRDYQRKRVGKTLIDFVRKKVIVLFLLWQSVKVYQAAASGATMALSTTTDANVSYTRVRIVRTD